MQYEILMLVSRADRLPVGEVAARLHRSGAFITVEASKRRARHPRAACSSGSLRASSASTTRYSGSSTRMLELLIQEAEAA